ncbi:MAG: arsenite methyltransferase [Bacteroidetes bacterium]|nr:MAG: arsenite methyltransferase [Bacteroidota bacterium]
MQEEIIAKGCCGSARKVDQHSVLSALEVEFDPTDGNQVKELVKRRYGHAATHAEGCGCGCSAENYEAEFAFVGEEYEGRDGYVAEADLGLGCGVPTDLADIKSGDTVLDLGSGAGIDAFIAREEVGENGVIIGVDFTPEMVKKATENSAKLGYDNVSFLEGDIEDLPIDEETVDVIISNCVLNLVPHKKEAFSEMYRVLKKGGHFTLSDIVIQGDLPDRLRESAALYAGCVSGAIAREDYFHLLKDAGFEDVSVVREHAIDIADEILLQMASEAEVQAFKASGGLASVTVTGFRRN